MPFPRPGSGPVLGSRWVLCRHHWPSCWTARWGVERKHGNQPRMRFLNPASSQPRLSSSPDARCPEYLAQSIRLTGPFLMWRRWKRHPSPANQSSMERDLMSLGGLAGKWCGLSRLARRRKSQPTFSLAGYTADGVALSTLLNNQRSKTAAAVRAKCRRSSIKNGQARIAC